MTLIGKILTGLIFILSIAFFLTAVFLNARHIDLKKQATTATTKADNLQRENTILLGQNEDLKTDLSVEQAARRSAIASLQTQVANLANDLQMQEAQLAQLQSENTLIIQTEQSTKMALDASNKDNTTLRQKLKDARQDRDQIFQRLVAAQDNLNRTQGSLKTVIDRERQLASDYTAAKEKLEILGIDPDTELLEPPRVNGLITLVDSNGLVEVDIGKDDGLREGFTLEVTRDQQYLGRLLIRRVADDKAIGEILRDYQKGYMRSGDRVDSKLY